MMTDGKPYILTEEYFLNCNITIAISCNLEALNTKAGIQSFI